MKGLIPKGIPFGLVPKGVMEDKDLSPNARCLYAYMCTYAGGGKGVFTSVRTLARGLGKTRRTIQRGLNALEDAGWIERKFRRGRSTLYTVNRDPSKKAEISFRNRRRKKRRVWPKKKGSRDATNPELTTKLSPGCDTGVTQTGATSVSPLLKEFEKYPLKDAPKDKSRPPIQPSDVSARPQLHPSRKGEGNKTESHPSQHSASTPEQDHKIAWEDLGIETRRVLPSFTKGEAYEWLADFLYRLQAEDISFKQDERFLYGLVHGAFMKITDDAFEDLGLDDGAKLAKLEELIRAEIDRYGEGGVKSLQVSKNRPVG